MEFGEQTEHVRVELCDRVLCMRIARPDKKNALNNAMYSRMAESVERAADDGQVRAIFVTGTEECFSSGNDVSSFAEPATAPGNSVDEAPPMRLIRAVAQTPLPLVAAVNGPAIGVGTTLLMHFDFVVAGERAVFKTPFVSLGVCPEAGSSYSMPLRLGYDSAARMLMLGESLDAGQALACGLVSEVHSSRQYQERALAIASRLAALPPASVRATKQLLRAPHLEAIERAIERENVAFDACMRTPEFSEAIAAFMERREPDFSAC
ncbi:MAG: enoyl-CoA hydratase [Pseudomonadota bacterium]